MRKKRPIRPYPKLNRRKGCSTSRGIHKKFNRRNKEIVYESIQSGLPMSRCAALLGISPVTWARWMDLGKDDEYPAYTSFRDKCLRLKVARERQALNIIRKCGSGEFVKTDTTVKKGPTGAIEVTKRTTQMYPQWQAEAWFLERRLPATYGREQFTSDKSPEEYAREINDAHTAIMNSVPMDSDI